MKRLFVSMALVASFAGASAQGIYIYKTDGTRLEFNYSEIKSIEAFQDEVVEEKLAVNGVEFAKDSNMDCLQAVITVKKGEVVNISGIKDIAHKVQPTYFDIDGNTLTFKAMDGKYKFWYSEVYDLVWVELFDDDWQVNFYPYTLYVAGEHQYHPYCTAEKALLMGNIWNFNQPWQYQCAVQTADNVYEVDMYLENFFMFRFYYSISNWGSWFGGIHVASVPEGYNGNDGHQGENFDPGDGFESGTYHVKLDLNDDVKTIYFTRWEE